MIDHGDSWQGKERVTSDESRGGSAEGIDLVPGGSSLVPAPGRGAFWPAAALYDRVPLDQRWRLLFDRGPSGAPECCLGWTDAQRMALATHAIAVRRWLHPIIERLPSRDELALVVGVEVEVLSRALDDDGRRTMAEIRARYAAATLPRDRGVA